MLVFKCKMCGDDLTITEGQNYGVCESCGSTMTLPSAADERKVNLFNRANHFRRSGEFDKALAAYESILSEDNTEAEAHWGAVLCRLGIEYVEDPASHERIPTVNRASLSPVLGDADYLAAIEHAPDAYTRELYEKEAATIAEIQKGILAVSQNEEPYDIFICYKESTDAGVRTKDSVRAQEIYHALTDAGYRVFFSRISLEDKVGRAYEPYIFAALNSAKVMLVVGTKAEHYNAVWVKNEWSRYLALMKNDRSRLLIPCYQDMDAYDIPDALSMLQAQDMNKLGFVQDLLRGIEKVIKSDAPQATQTAAVANASADASALLRRANIFLEDREWTQAEEYFERVLDMNPECSAAYWGKLLLEHKVTTDEDLVSHYVELLRNAQVVAHTFYCDIVLTEEQASAIKELRENDHARKEDFDFFKVKVSSKVRGLKGQLAQLQGNSLEIKAQYQRAIRYASEQEKMQYEKVASQIRAGWDKVLEEAIAQEQAEKDKNVIKHDSRIDLEIKRLRTTFTNREAAIVAKQKWKQEEAEAKRIAELEARRQKQTEEVARREKAYEAALRAGNEAKTAAQHKKAAAMFKAMGRHKNAAMEAEKQQGLAISAKEREKKRALLIASGVAVALLIILIVTQVVLPNVAKSKAYNEAVALLEEEKYDQAIVDFSALGEYKDSAEQIVNAKKENTILEDHVKILTMFEGGDSAKAIAALEKLDGDEEISAQTAALIDEGNAEFYSYAEKFLADGSYAHATRTFVALGNYRDAQERASSSAAQWRLSLTQSIAAANSHTAGLKKDGSVVAAGSPDNGRRNVSGWSNIVSISAGEAHTVGLRSNGTVIATGRDWKGQYNVVNWADIVAVSAGGDHTVGR